MASPSKFIVVTGCTRGLGKALVEHFGRQGHRVAGCGRTLHPIHGVPAMPGLRFDRVDVSKEAEVAAWARSLIAEFGTPDLLINNAGVIARNAPFWEVSDAEFSGVLDVNVRGVANVLRQFLPAMIERRHGVIVNMSSGWGRSTSPEVAAYCASKWAIEGLTQALAQDLPHGVSAVALNPGIINTGMLQSCFGTAALDYPGAEEWADVAGPFLLGLGGKENGTSLSVPGFPIE